MNISSRKEVEFLKFNYQSPCNHPRGARVQGRDVTQPIRFLASVSAGDHHFSPERPYNTHPSGEPISRPYISWIKGCTTHPPSVLWVGEPSRTHVNFIALKLSEDVDAVEGLYQAYIQTNICVMPRYTNPGPMRWFTIDIWRPK